MFCTSFRRRYLGREKLLAKRITLSVFAPCIPIFTVFAALGVIRFADSVADNKPNYQVFSKLGTVTGLYRERFKGHADKTQVRFIRMIVSLE